MNKSFDIGRLVRRNIRELVPYSSARDEFSGSASVFMDANENPYNNPLNRYPDPAQSQLKEKIAAIKGQATGRLFLGNGSDEGIDLLYRVLCEPGRDNVITVDPTYGMYGVCAAINGVERRSVLLKSDFSLDPEEVIGATDRHTRMIFLCSPNNPTANALDRRAMLRIVDSVACMVVVDEAYIDFSRQEGLLDLIPEKKNLVVLQTFSKAWGLAGVRLGMVFAHRDLIGYLSRVKYPYNVNSLTLEKVQQSLSDPSAMEEWVSRILKERDRLSGQLQSLPFVKHVYPSDANFLLVQMEQPRRIYRFLMERGIIVRDRSSVPLCRGCLRITVGTENENRLLMDKLNGYHYGE
ncbi:MAG: histidinol-phosphate transaminase [Bacteroidales bacterium]